MALSMAKENASMSLSKSCSSADDGISGSLTDIELPPSETSENRRTSEREPSFRFRNAGRQPRRGEGTGHTKIKGEEFAAGRARRERFHTLSNFAVLRTFSSWSTKSLTCSQSESSGQILRSRALT